MACKVVSAATLTLAAVVMGILAPATFATSPRGFRAALTLPLCSAVATTLPRHATTRPPALASLSAAGSGASSFQTLVEK